MELNYDWISFQNMFYPRKRRDFSNIAGSTSNPVYLIADGDVIVCAFAEKEDLSAWVGQSCQKIKDANVNRSIVVLDRLTLDKWVKDGCSNFSHFYDQVENLRRQTREVAGEDIKIFSTHFLIDAVYGWWSKVLPSSYGIYVRVNGQPEQDVLLLVKRGSFEAFHRPDLSSIGGDRKKMPAEVVKYLSERYLVPVQGLFVNQSDWNDWSNCANPWRKVALAIRSSGAKIVPFRWFIAMLVGLKALF